MNLTKIHEANVQALKVIYGSLVLVCKVFHSLNSQDLPQFGILEHLRLQVCENLGMYAQKYD